MSWKVLLRLLLGALCASYAGLALLLASIMWLGPEDGPSIDSTSWTDLGHFAVIASLTIVPIIFAIVAPSGLVMYLGLKRFGRNRRNMLWYAGAGVVEGALVVPLVWSWFSGLQESGLVMQGAATGLVAGLVFGTFVRVDPKHQASRET